MLRPLLLGRCQITFTHQYDSQIVHNKKTHVSEVIRTPIGTTAHVKTDEEATFGKSAPHVNKTTGKAEAFVYETGRKKALKSCFKKMVSLSKADRKRVWDEYNKLKTGGRW